MRMALALFCGICLVVGCVDRPSYESFTEELEDGASCARLFEVRNAMGPNSPEIQRMNEDLRTIGCYSSNSTRSDQ